MSSPANINAVLEARLAKARRFSESARVASRQRDYETAMSRCYYSSFHAMKGALLRYGARVGREPARHERVIDEFVKLGQRLSWARSLPLPPKHRDLRRTLKWLYDRRLDADYSEGLSIERRDVQLARDFVKNLVAEVERMVT